MEFRRKNSDGEYHQSYVQKDHNSKFPKKIVPVAVIAAVAILAAGDCTYQIQEQEQAVVTTFGVPKAVQETGLHFKLPLIQSVHKVNTTIQGFSIGYNADTNETVDSEGVMITSDYNFINVDFFEEYRIADPVKYLYSSEKPEEILKNISQSCIRTVIASYPVDDVLTTGKSEIQAKIKEMILTKMEAQDLGIQMVNITIQDSEPPTEEIVQAFKAVETAKQGKETSLNNANKYRNEQLPQAEAEADQIIQDAEAQKQVRINEAEAEVARFNAMYEEYVKNPSITKQRMFYEAMEDVLPDLKVIIDDGSGTEKILPIDSFTESSSKAAESTDE
jgi:membrane protease subunit HflK